jgi:predicted membrane protein
MSYVRYISTSALLGALGNILAIVSMFLGNIHPQIAIDMSHVATVIGAYILGPFWAALVGLLISIVPFIRFGIMGSLGPLIGSLIFPGKAMTGLFTGFLARRIRRPIIALTLGYVPESLFTWATFKLWIPIFAPQIAGWLNDAVIYGILVKAWFEILFIGAISELIIPRVKGMIPYGLLDKPGH